MQEKSVGTFGNLNYRDNLQILICGGNLLEKGFPPYPLRKLSKRKKHNKIR